MKKKFDLIKKQRKYSITSINNPAVQIATQILVGKVMRKCHMDEVLALMISLVAHCMKGVQFNWLCYLYNEFLANCREAHDDRKIFHYAWLLLSIVLVSWELPEDSEFPPLEKGLP